MPELFQTPMGHRFYESTMPRIATALENIAESLSKPAGEKPNLLPPHLASALKTVVANSPAFIPNEELRKAVQYIEGLLQGEELKSQL